MEEIEILNKFEGLAQWFFCQLLIIQMAQFNMLFEAASIEKLLVTEDFITLQEFSRFLMGGLVLLQIGRSRKFSRTLFAGKGFFIGM